MVGNLAVNDNTRRYLVITRHLNTQILKELGDTFQIADLAFTEQKPDEFAVPL